MSNEKKQTQENNFKFGLYLTTEYGSEMLYERIFTADVYNPVIRYSVNIKEMIPTIISKLQNVLHCPFHKLSFDDDYGYNTLDLNKNSTTLYKPSTNIRLNPNVNFQGRGNEFKFVLYINSHTIVERYFYVDNYVPEARYSNELFQLLEKTVERLVDHMKNTDINNMQDECDIITTYELNIQQVRELNKEKREQLLRKMNDYSFVEKIKMEYNKYPTEYFS